MKKNRRDFLRSTTAAGLVAPFLTVQSKPREMVQGYKYKVGYSWLPHMSSRPFTTFFSSTLDEALLADYRTYLPQVQEAGFEYVVIYGLIGEGGPNQMPVDLERGFSPKQDTQIRQVIDLIHGAGLKFLNGLGVYSWGFKNIIAAHREVASRRYKFRGITDYAVRDNALLLGDYDRLEEGEIPANPDIMCASREESWQWQERVVRFMLERYAVDGFHMESGDLGRCWCKECRKVDSLTYHARLNQRTTGLIKQIAPDKVVGINNDGILVEGIRTLSGFREMTRGANYFADVTDYYLTGEVSRFNDQSVWWNDRPSVASGLAPVAYGSLIHHRDSGLDRSTWFTPAPQTIVGIIGNSYRDGCRALEYYALGAFNNPSKEINNYCVGYALNHPDQGWREVLTEVIDHLYRPKSVTVRDGLVELFRNAEMSCLANDVIFNMVPKTMAPVAYMYQTTLFKQIRYLRELEIYLAEAKKLDLELGARERAARLVACLEGTIATVRESVQKEFEVAQGT